ncbi:MAG: PAS domain-containing protein [Anaerolineae bacterium]
MEETLKRAERGQGIILDSLVEHVVYEDATMRVLWANRAACESVGLTREELIGRHCYEIWQQRSEPCVGCPVLKAYQTGQPQEAEMTTGDMTAHRLVPKPRFRTPLAAKSGQSS